MEIALSETIMLLRFPYLYAIKRLLKFMNVRWNDRRKKINDDKL